METPPPVVPATLEPKSDRTWNMLCHLSCLAGLVVPFGNLVGPLIVWLIKRDEMPEVNYHGKASLNFQITVSLAALAVAIAGFFLSFVFIGVFLFPVAGLLGIAGLVFGVIAAIKASDGKEYVYPFSLTFIS